MIRSYRLQMTGRNLTCSQTSGSRSLKKRCYLANVVPALCVLLQLRREVRLRKEYLYRKAQEDRLRSIEEKKQKLKSALDGESDLLTRSCSLKLKSGVYVRAF